MRRARLGIAAVFGALALTMAAGPANTRVPDAMANLPVTFVENRGQVDRHVRYFARGPHYAFFLSTDEIVLSLARKSPTAPEGVSLGLRFLGANPAVKIAGAQRAPGNVNYFRGNDPVNWHTDLPSYEEMVYQELWPGVDLRLREKHGSLKYEFHVRPGARIEDIRMAYRGAEGISLDSAGGLAIRTAMGTIRDAAPVSFQEHEGVRTPVESHYLLEGGVYGFRVGAGYRADRELIIDPGVEYSTFLGGTSHEIATGIKVDAAGNAYVVGWTQSPDYPVTAGAFDRTGAAGNFADVFVAKLNPSGTALIYSTFIGGSDFEWGRAIAIDAAGNAYIAGQTKSSNFPTTSNAFDRSFNIPSCPRCGVDNYDAFVTKLNPSGSALVYSTYLGGAADIDDALSIAVDGSGSAYVTGETGSSDFPTTSGAFRRTKAGVYDAFVTKLNPAGSALVYSTFVGGAEVDFGVRIAVDSFNEAYVLGNTRSPDFPTTPGAFDTSANGAFDLFALKLNVAGSNLVYSTFLGGIDMDSAGGLAIDPAGNAYVAGTASAGYPTTPGAFQAASPDGGGVVTKLNAAGSALVYSTFVKYAGITALALAPAGNVWITGGASASSIPITPDAYQAFVNGGVSSAGDAFLTQLNAAGSAVLYSTYLGGSDTDYGTDLALDTSGNVYVAGETRSADFPTTPNALDRVFSGRLDIFWGDAFITKLALNGSPPPPPALPTIAAVTGPLGVVGGTTAAITVTLTGGAQGSGAVVSLVSNRPGVIGVPATLTIPSGTQTGSLNLPTGVVAADTPVTITATYNGSSKAVSITVLPPPPPAVLLSIGMFPNVVTGGTSTMAILAVSSPAPAGGFTASLSSNSPVATVPATITVPAGQTNIAFTVPVASVTQTTGMTIFATAGGRTEVAPLWVNPAVPPPPPPPTNVALTVTASGRSGERVTSSPSGINVAVGSSMQALFATGTSITLSVSNGREAVWSGACSSAGNKQKTCTFTLNGTASVSANVK